MLWRHIDGFKQEPDDVINGNGPAFVGDVPGPIYGDQNFGKIPSYDYFDLTGQFMLTDNITLTGSIENLFDKKPPMVGSSIGSTTFNSGNTYPSTYDTLGRRFSISARLKF